MLENLLPFLVVCPAAFLAGAIDAMAGGGGLITLPVYMLAGLPVHNAIATNKISSFMGTSIATWEFFKLGYINVRKAAWCIVAALTGSALGARLALAINDHIFKVLMLFILPFVAFYVIRNQNFAHPNKPFSERRTQLLSTAFAFLVGIYDGFYGPGTGTFLLLLLTGAARLSLQEANGLTKAINWTTNLAALTVFALSGKTLWSLGLTAGLFNIAGNHLGVKLFTKGGASFVRPAILLVLAIFMVKITTDLLAINN